MGTVVQYFGPRDAAYPVSNYAQFIAVSGTNFPVESLAFDTSTEETVFFRGRAMSYGSGDLTIRICWYADTASSGGVVFGASIAAITPNTDTTNIETKAFAAESTGSDTHLGTTGQRLHEFTITVSNLDSLADDDEYILKLARKTANAGDTMSGDCLVYCVCVEYSDT